MNESQNNTKGEEVFVSSTALARITIHSLIFSDALTKFRMVMGMLGGKVENEVVSVYKSICTSVGSFNRVSPKEISYVDISLFDANLIEENMFVVGWYVSMFPGGFYCETNIKNHFNWQRLNPKAIVIVVYPQEFYEENFEDFIKILRIKDLDSTDYSAKNWNELHVKILDSEYHQFLQDLSSNLNELKEIFNSTDQGTINQYFRKWELFSFEEKIEIISNLEFDVEMDDTLFSLYFTRDEIKTLYHLTYRDNPDFRDSKDFEILKKIKKDTNDVLTEIKFTKSEMRLVESYMQKESLKRIPGFESFNREERAKFSGIKSTIISKLRAGYTERH
ncbi:MAG: hypothetical protein ACFFDF_01605 [Candidatus Odinarchaeota archaeon]